jgi:hypothetical protein
VDLVALEKVLVRFNRLVVELPWIKEMDINPLLASPEKIVGLDARIVLHNPHVSFLTRRLRATATQDTVCFKCHADKAGPFVFENRRLCSVPHAARLFKPSPPGAQPGEFGLPGMPRIHSGCGAGGDAHIPQSGPEVSGLYALPCGDPRIECEQVLLASMKGEAMRDKSTKVAARLSRPASSVTVLWAIALVFASLSSARAQDQDEQKGIDQGNYNIAHLIEFGGRFVNNTGDQSIYDTFVNLQQGPRLPGFTTEMRSLDHCETVFDRLYFSNFGSGGDPNDVSHLRMSKNKRRIKTEPARCRLTPPLLASSRDTWKAEGPVISFRREMAHLCDYPTSGRTSFTQS